MLDKKKQQLENKILTEILINLQTDLYPLNLLLYKKVERYYTIPFNFLDGIGSIFITPPISLSPNCPPDALWDDPPPLLLTFPASSFHPATKQICSMLWHSPACLCYVEK